MVAGLAFVATAIATLFAQATAVRWSRSQAPHQGAWTFALALFALASAALATGASTGWDSGHLPRLLPARRGPRTSRGSRSAPCTCCCGRRAGDRVRTVLLVFTGVGDRRDARGADPRRDRGRPASRWARTTSACCPARSPASGSGIGAIVVFVGAAWSAVRFARSRKPGSGHLAGGNALIALGTLVLVERRLAPGHRRIRRSVRAHARGRDRGDLRRASPSRRASAARSNALDADAQTIGSDDNSRRSNLPANDLGNSSTSSTRVGSL